MKSKLLAYLQYIIFLGGGLFLVWWQLQGMSVEDKTEFKNALLHANYYLVIPVVIMNMASHLARALRWKLLLEPLEYYPSTKNTFLVTMVGYLANAAVPRLGEVVKCSMLAKYENLKTDKLIGTIVIERMFDVLCYFIFIGITVVIQIEVIGNYVKDKLGEIGNKSGIPLWTKVIIFLTIILALIIIFRKIISIYPDNKFLIKVKSFITGVANGIVSVKKLKKRREFISYTIFIWAMYLLQLYIAFYAMESTAHLSLKAACAVLSLSTLAMIVTPNGIGSFPLFVSQTLVMYGIATAQGKAYGWLIWGVSTLLIIVVGVISFLLLTYIKKKKNENQPSHTT